MSGFSIDEDTISPNAYKALSMVEGSGFEPELGHAIDAAPNELTFTNAQTKKEEDVWTMPTIGLEPTTLCL